MRAVTPEDFLTSVKAIHGDTYIYDKLLYTKANNHIEVGCKIHGYFNIRASKFKSGQGCQMCSKEHSQDYKRDTTESFIEKAKLRHNDIYNYDKTIYGRSNEDKVVITCTKHGDFIKTPTKHLMGQGCPACGFSRIRAARANKPNGWSYTTWDAAGKTSANFKEFSLYVIKCKNDKEEFIKVGKTFVGIQLRFRSTEAMPYKYEIIKQITHNAYAISALETKIKKEFKAHAYIPNIEFAGMYECLSLNTLDDILERLSKYENTKSSGCEDQQEAASDTADE